MFSTADRVAGRHAVITGGSSGIGLSVARLLGARGARVTLIARNRDRLTEAASELGRRGVTVAPVAADVADREAVHAAVRQAEERQGRTDILVTSAGQTRPERFLDLGDQALRELMEVNYFGTLHPIRAVVPEMVRQGAGSIVTIASGVALLGVYGYAAYAPTKFAVRGLSECLRDELRPYGVHVACVFPPDVDTPMFVAENVSKPPATRAISSSVPPIHPDVVAAAIGRAIDRGTFAVYPEPGMRLLAGVAPGLGPFVRRYKDRLIRRAGGDPPANDSTVHGEDGRLGPE